MLDSPTDGASKPELNRTLLCLGATQNKSEQPSKTQKANIWLIKASYTVTWMQYFPITPV